MSEILKDLGEIPGKFESFLKNPTLLDDRTGLFNQGFNVLSKLPPGSVLGRKLNDGAITMLYETLPHPPGNFLGNDNQFRQPDGGNNNLDFPDLGRAGTAYARTCQGKHPLPVRSLPSTSLVFDELLRGNEKRDPHPGGNSSLIFAFASLVTHSLFRTDPKDWNKNNTTSYLDLSPLYGSNKEELDAIRPKDGHGYLYPDCFSESRLGLLPPAAAALLVVWSRNHNYIATNLLKINERERWVDPPPAAEDARLRQDEEIFQTARLINCGSFMSVIFGDYVAGFLGLSRSGSSWSMQPFDPITALDGHKVGRGEGNHVSVEFNLLYRWHATLSNEDEKWTIDMFKRIFEDKPVETLTDRDFYAAAEKLRNLNDPDPRKRTFAGLKRGPTGRFDDADIAKVLHDSTESLACRYGARGVPSVLKIIEQMGMEQARKWGVCTMNEFRERMGLRPFSNFEEWNPNPQVAAAAKRLYGTIDNLELYPGLHAEETMPLGPGSGLCAGYTVTRGILSDAIALVRGDRFFTTDFTPANLTAWGMSDIARDPNNGGFGGYLPKLLMRALPRHYTYNSVYSLFPFFTPSSTKTNLTNLKLESQYDFNRPKGSPIPKFLNNFTAIKHVFNDVDKYKGTYARDMGYLTKGYGMFLMFDDQPRHDNDRSLAIHALFPDKQSVDDHITNYATATRERIRSKSFKYDTRPEGNIDIVRDVINPITIAWTCEHMFGSSIKSAKNPGGEFEELELYNLLAAMFTCVFRNNEAYSGWAARYEGKKASDRLSDVIRANINKASWDLLGKSPFKTFIQNLKASGKSIDEVVAMILGLSVGSTVNYSQAAVQVIEFYLDDKRAKERQDIIELSARTDEASKQRLIGYYREAARLSPQFPALLRVCAKPDTIPQGEGRPSITVNPGDILFCSFKNAHMDPELFPNPETVDPTRPRENYSIQGTGTHGCPGLNFSELTISAIIKEIFSLPNLRRAPGSAGIIESFTTSIAGTEARTFIDEKGELSGYPGSLWLQYDSFEPQRDAPKQQASLLSGVGNMPSLFSGLHK